MDRRSILTISATAAFAVALIPGSAFPQQRSLKEQLVGTWTFVSCDSTAPNGAKQPYCANPANGILIFDAGGRYASVIAGHGRSKLASGNRSEVPAVQGGGDGAGGQFRDLVGE